jgi:hypothetical protein
METNHMKNLTLNVVLLLCLLAGFGLWVGVTWGAETGDTNGFYKVEFENIRAYAVSTYWPDATSYESCVSLNPLWGPPTGLLSTTFYDNASAGQALTAAKAGDRNFLIPDQYEAADLSDGQITLYHSELDGTYDALTTSVWTIDIFYWLDNPNWMGQ